MKSFAKALNDMLISVYHNILRVEEEFLQKQNNVNLSIREMHMIEFIGSSDGEAKTLSEIAGYLKIAKPSVTVAVRKLTEKGFLTRSGCAKDGRVVKISLTRNGQKIYRCHMMFHMAMVREIELELDESERDLLIRVMGKLDDYFDRSVGGDI